MFFLLLLLKLQMPQWRQSSSSYIVLASTLDSISALFFLLGWGSIEHRDCDDHGFIIIIITMIMVMKMKRLMIISDLCSLLSTVIFASFLR